VTDPARLPALREEWEALWARTPGAHASQGFDWCVTGWQTTATPRGRTLAVLVLREAGRATLIWPLTLRRRLWARIAMPLGAESTEYDPALIEPGADAPARLAAAWAFLRAELRADAICVPFVRPDSAMHGAIADLGLRGRTETLPAPFVAWGGQSWQDYMRGRSGNLRTGIARRRRRLAERGALAFTRLTDPAAIAPVIDWALRQKSGWMSRKTLDNDFIREAVYRRFLAIQAAAPGAAGQLAVFTLTLDGALVAAKIGTLDGTRYEGFITAHDPAFASFSPGQLILADTLAWCHARGLDYDFRIGTEAYKAEWATASVALTTHNLSLTARGALLQAWDRLTQRHRIAVDRLRQRLPTA
jgi:CelD/BcsL family acetyltransferase involved in cellulose biosynthesis